MRNLIVITENVNPKKFNVDLWSPNTGREKDGYMSAGKAFGVGIREARKVTKEEAALYEAEIEDRTGKVAPSNPE